MADTVTATLWFGLWYPWSPTGVNTDAPDTTTPCCVPTLQVPQTWPSIYRDLQDSILAYPSTTHTYIHISLGSPYSSVYPCGRTGRSLCRHHCAVEYRKYTPSMHGFCKSASFILADPSRLRRHPTAASARHHSESVFIHFRDVDSDIPSAGIQVRYSCMTSASNSHIFNYVVSAPWTCRLACHIAWYQRKLGLAVLNRCHYALLIPIVL